MNDTFDEDSFILEAMRHQLIEAHIAYERRNLFLSFKLMNELNQMSLKLSNSNAIAFHQLLGQSKMNTEIVMLGSMANEFLELVNNRSLWKSCVYSPFNFITHVAMHEITSSWKVFKLTKSLQIPMRHIESAILNPELALCWIPGACSQIAISQGESEGAITWACIIDLGSSQRVAKITRFDDELSNGDHCHYFTSLCHTQTKDTTFPPEMEIEGCIILRQLRPTSVHTSVECLHDDEHEQDRRLTDVTFCFKINVQCSFPHTALIWWQAEMMKRFEQTALTQWAKDSTPSFFVERTDSSVGEDASVWHTDSEKDLNAGVIWGTDNLSLEVALTEES